MDPITMIYYALVCGCLSAVIPRFSSVFTRAGIGAVVGIVAAIVLPIVKGALGL